MTEKHISKRELFKLANRRMRVIRKRSALSENWCDDFVDAVAMIREIVNNWEFDFRPVYGYAVNKERIYFNGKPVWVLRGPNLNFKRFEKVLTDR